MHVPQMPETLFRQLPTHVILTEDLTLTRYSFYPYDVFFFFFTIVGASFIVTINDFGELEEGDTVNFTCTWIGSTTPNTSLTYFYFFFNRDISGAFMNSTLNPVIEYDNSTQNYTTIFKVSNVVVDRRFNYQFLSCFGNLGFASAGKRLTVYCESQFYALFNDCNLQLTIKLVYNC